MSNTDATQIAFTYALEFTLPGLPKTANALLRGTWRGKHTHAQNWKRAVWGKCWHKRPPEPLKTARLTLTRLSSVEPDYDGLVSSFKPVIDGLVESKVIANDRPANIGRPEYLWVRTTPRMGRITVRVENA